MLHIVVLTHTYDDFEGQNYLLRKLAEVWVQNGYRVSVVAGTENWPDADVAILHVDLTIVPVMYSAARERYRVVVNGAALDISKTIVSRCLVDRGDDWDGPVVVKTNLNSGGLPELRAGDLARRNGKQQAATPLDFVSTFGPYPILRGLGEVSEAVWNSPGLVVERFLPERDARGFWIRAWVFFGDRERCTRYLGDHPIVKTGNILAHEPAPVPDELRSERERLGFDYGKFDFVMHDGKAILFDANRTPGAPPSVLGSQLAASNANLALGLSDLLAA